MRTNIFRLLAGLLTVMFIWLLTMAPNNHMPLPQLIGTIAVTVLFGLFALFGPDAADRWLIFWLGHSTAKKPPDEEEKNTRQN